MYKPKEIICIDLLRIFMKHLGKASVPVAYGKIIFDIELESSIFEKYQLHPRRIDASIQSELDKYLQKSVEFGWLKCESSSWETTAVGDQICQLTNIEFQRVFHKQKQDWFERKMGRIKDSGERLQTEISRKPGLDNWRY